MAQNKVSMWLNYVLFATFTIGLFINLSLQWRYWKLAERRDELNADFGAFSDEYKTKAQLIRLKTDDPMVFRWRLYLPAGFRCAFADMELGSTGGSGRTVARPDKPADIILTHSFPIRSESDSFSLEHTTSQKNWIANELGTNYSGGGHGGIILSGDSARFVLDHWDDLDFSFNCSNGEPIDAGTKFTLLKIEVPENLMSEFSAVAARSGLRIRSGQKVPLLEVSVTITKL